VVTADAEAVGATAAAQTPSATYHSSHGSIESINARVLARLGVDFLLEAGIDKRTRYLSKECGALPPVNSAERDSLRNGISLQQWVALQEGN
jgi:hypothetical protein